MGSEGECNLQPMLTVAEKKGFLEKLYQKQKELTRRQRDYKKVLADRLKTRNDTIAEKSYSLAIQKLCKERDDLRAQIYVANSVTHIHDNNRYLKQILCHIDCQEHLAYDIKRLKTDIPNMERQIGRLDREIHDLNLKTIPDAQHEAHVNHTRKIMRILEDELEMTMKRECALTATNVSLREEFHMMLKRRAFFNEIYGKLIQRLNSDKKYLIDLIDFALYTFENCIEIYEKIDYIRKKDRRDRDQRKMEMQSIMRKIAAAEDENAFLDTKGKARTLADLQPKEYRRREAYRYEHNRKINLYKNILQKIFQYTSSSNVDEVIEKFQTEESLYYSYFTFANEMSFHMTILDTSVNRLYSEVNILKAANRGRYKYQIDAIAALEKELQGKQDNNQKWAKAKSSNDQRINNLLEGIQSVVRICNVDTSALMDLLGNHTLVSLTNVSRFVKLLERRLAKLVASVYVMERSKDSKDAEKYIVRGTEKIYDYLTDVNDIVLTQQCPECAEGEALNNDERGDGGIVVYTKEESKKSLYEKIQQPEMQYRLHSLSQCRLPRSRVLTAKRNA